ncbi:MAG: type 2 isopentenyl-diphosphate Delta-isomerase [Candidatus Micrarchaeota archaeon]|nr:type 2 isopentenyl-diphosphate Delta-isomerase [Candidatus Micrarchaeota archaeon]MCX8154814.1 type 2 isopentenyl-diphosphate Delta-isomerase [Candidatus Micrarchaeota archaeon]
MDDIQSRKREHVLNSMKSESQYDIGSWLDCVMILHNALPEMDFHKIDTRKKIFGREFNYPIYISGMTGGYDDAYNINMGLADLAEEYNIPMGVGSIRAMLKNANLKYTYNVKRGREIYLIANIGGVQLKEYSNKQILDALDSIEADALAIHLNPAQELIQREGDLNWEGVKSRIGEISDHVQVIVKEVGAGLSNRVVSELREVGVRYFDVAGMGGTSWTKIEYMRNPDAPRGFENWGIPTALSILMNREERGILASGGIRDGLDGFRAIVLGAEMFGMARPFLEMVLKNQKNMFERIVFQFRGAMFLAGARDLDEIRNVKYILLDPLRSAYEQIRSSIPKK